MTSERAAHAKRCTANPLIDMNPSIADSLQRTPDAASRSGRLHPRVARREPLGAVPYVCVCEMGSASGAASWPIIGSERRNAVPIDAAAIAQNAPTTNATW
jgi:hypothetical protein